MRVRVVLAVLWATFLIQVINIGFKLINKPDDLMMYLGATIVLSVIAVVWPSINFILTFKRRRNEKVIHSDAVASK